MLSEVQMMKKKGKKVRKEQESWSLRSHRQYLVHEACWLNPGPFVPSLGREAKIFVSFPLSLFFVFSTQKRTAATDNSACCVYFFFKLVMKS